MTNRPDLFNPLIHAIATALDVPVTAFLSDPLGDDGGDVIALLRAWAAISDAQGHRRVLNAALREADRSNNGLGLVAENVTPLSSDHGMQPARQDGGVGNHVAEGHTSDHSSLIPPRENLG